MQKVKKGLIPSIAKKIGQRSVGQVCYWFFNQPKVPEALLKAVNEEKK